MTYYKSKRFVDRLKWVIVDETGKVVNNDPSREELKVLRKNIENLVILEKNSQKNN